MPFHFLDQLRLGTSPTILAIVDLVWAEKDAFVRWPAGALLFLLGCVRDVKYHDYDAALKARCRAAGFQPDTRSNGPAINAFRLAGGVRPKRHATNHEWSVHHIYDGKFPAPDRATTTHAVNDGRYFSEAAGLVAVHPIADALADEVPYFAWLLRSEALDRFGFNPDDLQASQQPPQRRTPS